MTKFIAHEIEISMATNSKGNQSDKLRQENIKLLEISFLNFETSHNKIKTFRDINVNIWTAYGYLKDILCAMITLSTISPLIQVIVRPFHQTISLQKTDLQISTEQKSRNESL